MKPKALNSPSVLSIEFRVVRYLFYVILFTRTTELSQGT
jgi:hypothetical protein